MNIKTALQGLMKAIVEEAEQNPEFAKKIESALGIGGALTVSPSRPRPARSKRAPAVFDPIDVARQGENALRERLATLDIEQLKDIVADYAMDPGKVVMKLKAPQRIIERIVELSLARAVKGDVFLK